jgi:hypothetical protein
MGPRTARGNHKAIQTVFFYDLKELFLSILRAGKQTLFRDDYVGKVLDVLHDSGNINGISDVDSATADEYADTRLFFRNIPLRRKLNLRGHGVPG